jgi:hypothetical protein
MILAGLTLLLLLAGCAADTGITPSNRYIDRDMEATRRGDLSDVQDLRASPPGLSPVTRETYTYAPF